MALILDPRTQIERAVRILKRGEPVGLPTETVYGLAADALNPEALARIFALKARPTFDPLIVHVRDFRDVGALARPRFDLERRILETFWPGPLTLLLPKDARVPDLATAALPTVALRSPSHPVFRAVLEAFGGPLAAPSANRFGRVSPTRAQDVVTELGPHGLEAVVDGGACEWGVESTILQVVAETRIRVLRPGALALDQLQAKLGTLDVEVQTSSSSPQSAQVAPGLLESHYAPRSPLCFVEAALPEGLPTERAVLLSFGPDRPAWARGRRWAREVSLSEQGLDREAASRLFARMRELDGAACIVAEKLPDAGLGLAVNDRLRRAGAGFRLDKITEES